jgi:MoxR-like ATPase
VFANVVLVDELNRATPKAQSGLLEAMQEGQVSVDGTSWPLPRPLVVLATQNPAAGQDGTYRLPAAQLDRFLARVSLGYPTAAQELALLRGGPQLTATAPACSPSQLLAAQRATVRVHAADALLGYLVAVLRATRAHPLAEVGASPRAGLGLLAAARARAALQGRGFVVPDDVKALAQPVLAHRIQPLATTAAAEAPAQVVADAIAQVPAR